MQLLPGHGFDFHAEQGLYVGVVEHIFFAAKIAVDGDAALFGHDIAHFLPAQKQQHVAHFATRAGAGEFDLFRLKHARQGLEEQAVEQVLGIEFDQFLRSNGISQGGVVCPGVGIDLLFR